MKLCTLIFLIIGVETSYALYAKRAFVCGSTDYLTVNNGHISSHSGLAAGHNYGKNMDCIWKIEAPAGLFVELVAVTFDLEDEASCSYDWLELFDGDGTHTSSMGKFCGRRFNPVTSNQRFMTLQFITDAENQATGFNIFYNFTDQHILSCHGDQLQCNNGRCVDINYKCDLEDDCGDDSDEQDCTGIIDGSCNADQYECPDKRCISRDWLCDGDNDCGDMSDELPQNCNVHQGGVCGESNHTGTHGTISSPNYPNPYLNSLHCIYHIIGPAGAQSIHFHFDHEFHVEEDEACSYDFIRASSGIGTSQMHGPFCGVTAPPDFSITGDHAYIVFTTDISSEYTGYRLTWNAT